LRLPHSLPALRGKPPRPKGFTDAQWHAVLVAGDRALFAFRILRARREEGLDQRVFGARVGVSQQTVSEWERGERVHVTTDMLHLGRLMITRSAEWMIARPEDIHSDAGRVFWMAAASELAAVTTGAARPTVRDVLAAAVRRSGTAR